MRVAMFSSLLSPLLVIVGPETLVAVALVVVMGIWPMSMKSLLSLLVIMVMTALVAEVAVVGAVDMSSSSLPPLLMIGVVLPVMVVVVGPGG